MKYTDDEIVTNIETATKSEIIKFCFGGVGVNFIIGILAGYIIYFLTDVAGVLATFAGTIFLIANIINAFSAPVVGIIADRINTRWGKYRPFVLFGTPIVVIVFILTFSVPNISTSLKVVYYSVFLTLLCIGNTVLAITNEALTPLMSELQQQRNSIVMTRSILGGLVMPIIMGLSFKLANDVFGGGTVGWQKLVIVYSIPIVISMYISASGSKNHDKPSCTTEKKETPTLKEQLNAFVANKALLLLILAGAPSLIANTVVASAAMYFNTYIMGMPNLIMTVSIVGMPIVIVITALTPVLIKKLGKKKVFTIAICGTFVQPLAYLIFKPFPYVPVVVALNIFNLCAFNMSIFASKSMLADCVEYGKWKTGMKSAGVVASSYTCIGKLSGALGGASVGLIMGAVGYIAGQQQTPLVLKTIISIVSIIPICTGIISIIAIKFYPVTEEFYSKILKEIKEKEAATV